MNRPIQIIVAATATLGISVVAISFGQSEKEDDRKVERSAHRASVIEARTEGGKVLLDTDLIEGDIRDKFNIEYGSAADQATRYDLAEIQVGTLVSRESGEEPLFIKARVPADIGPDAVEAILNSGEFRRWVGESMTQDKTLRQCSGDSKCSKTCKDKDGKERCCEWTCT